MRGLLSFRGEAAEALGNDSGNDWVRTPSSTRIFLQIPTRNLRRRVMKAPSGEGMRPLIQPALPVASPATTLSLSPFKPSGRGR